MVNIAKKMSEECHKGQTISDGKPYSVHINNVVNNLIRFGYNEPLLICGGYLHDSVEDTDLTIEEIKSQLGDEVADIVHRVTDEPGKNRKERKMATYPKIKGHRGATIVKLCDRIANVEYESGSTKNKYFEMYKKEYPDFKSNLYVPGICDSLWLYLDNLFS